MSGVNWLSVISLTGCLVLALGALRARQSGSGKTVVLALAWVAIFLLVAGLFTAIGH